MVALSAEQLEQVQKIIDDPLVFMSGVLKIQDKMGQIVPLVPNQSQMKLHGEIQRQEAAGMPVRIIVLKARQLGFSTYATGRFYYKTSTTRNTNTMIIAHKNDASTAIFNKNKLFYELSPPLFQPLRKNSNAKELVFENPTNDQLEKQQRPGLRSRIMIETAVNKDAGRSLTIHNLHLSELAFWPYPKETLTSCMQAVPNQPGTCVIIESTANGVGGEFYEQWMKANRGESPFVPLFFPWHECTEYTMPVSEGFKADDEEQELARAYNLTDGQLVWRRWCIQANCQGSLDRFHQEYPATPHEAFIASGRPVFDSIKIDAAIQKAKLPKAVGRVVEDKGRTVFRPSQRGYLSIWEWPQDGLEYVIGIDVAEGLEHGDFSVMEVFQRLSGEQVAEWHGHIAPDLLGEEAAKLGRFFNLALLVPEANNHGISVIDTLRRNNYPRIYRRRTVGKITNREIPEYGVKTSGATKPMIIDALGAFLRERLEGINSRGALQEMLTYVYNAKGGTEAQGGCYDDRVMGCGMAVWAMHQRKAAGKKPKTRTAGDIYGIDATTGY